jgi:putative Mg2+ transporter-C (MgtC) family protein
MLSQMLADSAITATQNIFESTTDGLIIEWFNTGFGTQNEYCWWGNLILITLSLIFATVYGGIIGYQREINGHAAGFRTHILIALGSALIMIISNYGYSFTGGGTTTRDSMRLAAAGVTGIGFLGAGSIIQNGFNIKGLTTAASIWVTMAIGMCCGAGSFVVGTIGTILAILCLATFRKLEVFASKKNCNVLLVVQEDVPVLTNLLDIANKLQVTVKDISSNIVIRGDKKYLRVVFKIASTDKNQVQNYLDELNLTFKPTELRILS